MASALFFVAILALLSWSPIPSNGSYLSFSANLNAMKKLQGQIQGLSTGQYRSSVSLTTLQIIGLDPGTGQVYDIRNLFSFTGTVLKQRPVKFVTEQNGYGTIYASFNGGSVKCDGIPGAKRKVCTIDASKRPWAGRFKVWTLASGSTPSAAFQMSANAVCQNAAFDGDMCNQDINECTKYKDRRICAWKDGCVNTHGSYICRCPAGYVVSKADFRNCDALLPEISSKSQMLTVVYQNAVELPCRYKGPPLVKRAWLRDQKAIVMETKAGVLLPNVVPQRFSLDSNGTLKISSTKFDDKGVYTCLVQTAAGITTRRAHMVNVESKPLLGIQFLSNGTYVAAKEHRVGDTIVVECQALMLPLGKQHWNDQSGTAITQSSKHKLSSGQLKGRYQDAIFTRLQINNAMLSDSGRYTCSATNARGTASKSVMITIKS